MQARKHASGGIHLGFETQGRRHQKSKTGVSVAPRKGHLSYKNLKKKKIQLMTSPRNLLVNLDKSKLLATPRLFEYFWQNWVSSENDFFLDEGVTRL